MAYRKELERVLYDGSGARVVAVPDEGGTYRAVDYLEKLGNKRFSDFEKVSALLERVAEVGPQNINNERRVKPLGDGLFEIKAHQVRLIWCYGPAVRNRRTVVLLLGVTKQDDRHRPRDLARAAKIRTYYEALK